jgi:hypothetical protein
LEKNIENKKKSGSQAATFLGMAVLAIESSFRKSHDLGHESPVHANIRLTTLHTTDQVAARQSRFTREALLAWDGRLSWVGFKNSFLRTALFSLFALSCQLYLCKSLFKSNL